MVLTQTDLAAIVGEDRLSIVQVDLSRLVAAWRATIRVKVWNGSVAVTNSTQPLVLSQGEGAVACDLSDSRTQA